MNRPKNFKEKKKEKLFEDYLHQVKEQQRILWKHNKPLFTILKIEDKFQFIPLEKDFFDATWVILYVDIGSYEIDLIVHVIEKWKLRYQSYKIKFLLLIANTFEYTKTLKPVENFLESSKSKTLFVLDQDKLFSSGLGLQHYPEYLILHQGKKFSTGTCATPLEEKPSTYWFLELEHHIQNIIRSTEYGVAAPLLYNPLESSASLGVITKNRILFSHHALSIPHTKENYKIHVTQDHPPSSQETLPGNIYFLGAWHQNLADYQTSDPLGKIQWTSSTSHIGINIGVQGKLSEIPWLIVCINERTPHEDFLEKSISINESREASFKIYTSGFIPLLKNIPSGDLITLSFKNHQKHPISIYSIEMGTLTATR